MVGVCRRMDLGHCSKPEGHPGSCDNSRPVPKGLELSALLAKHLQKQGRAALEEIHDKVHGNKGSSHRTVQQLAEALALEPADALGSLPKVPKPVVRSFLADALGIKAAPGVKECRCHLIELLKGPASGGGGDGGGDGGSSGGGEGMHKTPSCNVQAAKGRGGALALAQQAAAAATDATGAAARLAAEAMKIVEEQLIPKMAELKTKANEAHEVARLVEELTDKAIVEFRSKVSGTEGGLEAAQQVKEKGGYKGPGARAKNEAAREVLGDRCMTRSQYAKHLRSLLGERELEGQDVFHIIANSKGGADHPDNYLYALGSTFNRSIGDRFDDLIAFLAGKEKTEKAVRASMKHGNALDPRGKPVKKYDPFKHGGSSSDPGDEAGRLFASGQRMLTALRQARRAEARAGVVAHA